MKKVSLIFMAIVTAACATVDREPAWRNLDEHAAEMVVFRESGSHSKLLSAYFGSGENYVVSLGENDYTSFKLPPGPHVFRAKAQGSASATVNLNLDPKTKACVRVIADPAQWVAAAVPIAGAGIPAFKIDRVDCPSEAILKTYNFVHSKT